MQNVFGEHSGRFQVHCSTCRRRRQFIPIPHGSQSGVLLCPGRCDGVPPSDTWVIDVLPEINEMVPPK